MLLRRAGRRVQGARHRVSFCAALLSKGTYRAVESVRWQTGL